METNLKQIKGYENLYSITPEGKVWSHIYNKWLKGDIRKGYIYYVISKNGKRYCTTAHRLVAKTFIKEDETRKHVNHKNGIKTDNRVENLEWCTSGENQKHAIVNGLKKGLKGERNGASKLTEKDILAIRNNKDKNQRQLAKEFGISFQHVSKILKRQEWKHI